MATAKCLFCQFQKRASICNNSTAPPQHSSCLNQADQSSSLHEARSSKTIFHLRLCNRKKYHITDYGSGTANKSVTTYFRISTNCGVTSGWRLNGVNCSRKRSRIIKTFS
ncbi:unnamed protein product [Ceratitis capitata]|uniref:(Mediterranean fruit fly) hypothetical protein n=1 Tax=Ceratitis capitata TaxID=7213 RepID=A0A811UU96_CERCA|nr:unnamed protein product [Ceratitis capitata]